MDFRLGFGGSFGDDTQIVVIGQAPPEHPHPREVACELYGGVAATLDALREGAAGGPDRSGWLAELRAVEDEKRAARARGAGRRPRAASPDAAVQRAPAGDRPLDDRDRRRRRLRLVRGPGDRDLRARLLDGPRARTAASGSGPGYAIAAKLARPDRQVCLLLGDGAFGFAGLEFDTMVRHGLPVVGVMGNNGIWALEKHPMEFLYGYSVAADLQPELRYDKVVETLGRPRRARHEARRAQAGARARVRVGQAGARERADGPDGRLPAQVEPGLEREPPPRGRRFKLAPSGRAGVRAMKGPNGSDGGRRRYDAASPEPMYRANRGLPNGTSLLTRRGESTPGALPCLSNIRPVCAGA